MGRRIRLCGGCSQYQPPAEALTFPNMGGSRSPSGASHWASRMVEGSAPEELEAGLAELEAAASRWLDLRDRIQPAQDDLRRPEIARMHDQIASSQRIYRLRAQQPVGVRDQTDDTDSGGIRHIPMLPCRGCTPILPRNRFLRPSQAKLVSISAFPARRSRSGPNRESTRSPWEGLAW